MHELTLAQGILSIIDSEDKKNSFDRVLEVSLKIGEFSGIIPSCLLEFFPIAAKDTKAEGAKLKISVIPAAFTCLDCGYEGAVDRKEACCPKCKSQAIRMTAGREFYVESLNVE
jgi:hydrogenase nickel incorporation protein HypA/HybF